jgi:hypothetical protein
MLLAQHACGMHLDHCLTRILCRRPIPIRFPNPGSDRIGAGY